MNSGELPGSDLPGGDLPGGDMVVVPVEWVAGGIGSVAELAALLDPPPADAGSPPR